jgi:glycosyltransferase involved in cell wall biosynthesis
MAQPLVSIITPTYNHEKYAAECIESVIGQSFNDWEQIVVDDGSSDRTLDVVRSFDDPRIRVISLPHRGLASLGDTYNAALQVAQGRLIAILEGDDRWPAYKLERQLPVFDDQDVYLSWGRARLIDEASRDVRDFVTVRTNEEQLCFDRKDLFAKLVRVNSLTPTASVIVRRSALDRVGGFRQTGSSLYVDLPTWLWITALNEGRACFINETLAHYRVHRNQTSQLHRREMESEHLKIVLALAREAPTDALRDVGWNESIRREALFAGLLAEGLGSLATGDFRGANPRFRLALRRSRTIKDFIKASIGLASATSHVDLLSRAYRAHSRLLSRSRPVRRLHPAERTAS